MARIETPKDVSPLDYYIKFKRGFTKSQILISTVDSVKDNLRQAEMVRDEPIGLFLCYTAEEEAATFLYLAMREQKYNVPDFKNLTNHRDKIKIFLLALCIDKYLFSEIHLGDALVLMMEEIPREKSHPRNEIRAYTEMAGYKIAVTDPILNIKTKGKGVEGLKKAVIYDVENALRSVGMGESKDYDGLIKKLANRRNLCLYGEPKVKWKLDSKGSLSDFENNCVFLICLGYMFLQTERKSEAIQEIINTLFDRIGWPKE